MVSMISLATIESAVTTSWGVIDISRSLIVLVVFTTSVHGQSKPDRSVFQRIVGVASLESHLLPRYTVSVSDPSAEIELKPRGHLGGAAQLLESIQALLNGNVAGVVVIALAFHLGEDLLTDRVPLRS